MLADTICCKRRGAISLFPFAAALVVATVWVLPEGVHAQTRSVHIPESFGSVSLRTQLNAAFGKQRIPLAIASEPRDADYVLQSFAVSREDRKKKWHEGVLSPQQESFAVVVKLLDRCGDVAWVETAGDLPAIESSVGYVPNDPRAEPGLSQAEVRVSMDRLVGAISKRGPEKVANRIARRLRAAIRRGDVRVSPRTCPQPPN